MIKFDFEILIALHSLALCCQLFSATLSRRSNPQKNSLRQTTWILPAVRHHIQIREKSQVRREKKNFRINFQQNCIFPFTTKTTKQNNTVNMVDKIEMSLDDIIKSNKKTKGFGGGKRRAPVGASRGGPKGSPKKFGAGGGRGGVAKGRRSGGITRPNARYTRVRHK